GRVLMIKSALLTVLIVIGWFNRYRLVPLLASLGEPGGARLRRTVRIEIVLLAGAVLAVGFLPDLPPGREAGPPAAGARSQAAPGPPAFSAPRLVPESR